MIQDIKPLHLNNQYTDRTAPDPMDIICIFKDDGILCRTEQDQLILPRRSDFSPEFKDGTYLFSIGDTAWMLVDEVEQLPSGFGFDKIRPHRSLSPREMIFGEMTAWHLYVWYRDNRFCGRCGHPTVHSDKLRMLSCPSCGNMIFPKLCPAVIVGIVNGDRILLTRYAGRAYKHYALIAGFVEIGETCEEAAAREAYEEVGIHVKNIRYWNSQPWGIDSALLVGFFCEPADNSDILLDTDELSHAGWYSREEIDFEPDSLSLTHDMIRAFKEGRNPQ